MKQLLIKTLVNILNISVSVILCLWTYDYFMASNYTNSIMAGLISSGYVLMTIFVMHCLDNNFNVNCKRCNKQKIKGA